VWSVQPKHIVFVSHPIEALRRSPAKADRARSQWPLFTVAAALASLNPVSLSSLKPFDLRFDFASHLKQKVAHFLIAGHARYMVKLDHAVAHPGDCQSVGHQTKANYDGTPFKLPLDGKRPGPRNWNRVANRLVASISSRGRQARAR
jgi:hypothetical protein